MKTILLKQAILLLFLGCSMTAKAQGIFKVKTDGLSKEKLEKIRDLFKEDMDAILEEALFANHLKSALKALPFSDKEIDSIVEDQLSEKLESDRSGNTIKPEYEYWAPSVLGGGLGVGFFNDDDNTETAFCASAEGAIRLHDGGVKGAGYLGAVAGYHRPNPDANRFNVGVEYVYYDPIVPFNKIQFTYGSRLSYENGNQNFNGFRQDFTGISADIRAGVNFRLNNKLSIGGSLNVLRYSSLNFNSNGSENRVSSFSAGINKGNIITFSARIPFNTSSLPKEPELLKTY